MSSIQSFIPQTDLDQANTWSQEPHPSTWGRHPLPSQVH